MLALALITLDLGTCCPDWLALTIDLLRKLQVCLSTDFAVIIWLTWIFGQFASMHSSCWVVKGIKKQGAEYGVF